MSGYPWGSLFGWEFIKAVVVSLFICAGASGLLGFVAGGVPVPWRSVMGVANPGPCPWWLGVLIDCIDRRWSVLEVLGLLVAAVCVCSGVCAGVVGVTS